MIGIREPGYLWKINIPFIYGPVGGLTYYPKEFILNSGIYVFIYSLAYNIIDSRLNFKSKENCLKIKVTAQFRFSNLLVNILRQKQYFYSCR